MSNTQAKVGIEKREHPERFCRVKGCLWRIQIFTNLCNCNLFRGLGIHFTACASRQPKLNPCRKHPLEKRIDQNQTLLDTSSITRPNQETNQAETVQAMSIPSLEKE